MSAWTWANLGAIGLLCSWIASHSYPLVRAVRLRNALLFRPSGPADFTWGPAAAPADFALETCAPHPVFSDTVRALGIGRNTSDWDAALRLAEHLTKNTGDRGPIQADLQTTYRRLQQGYGYCADFTKVFLGLAHAAGLFARQWAFSFDGFGGHGHALVEVFDRQRGKWLLLDVFNNFHAVDAASGEPLGALEFRERLLDADHTGAKLVKNGAGRPGWSDLSKAFVYYRRGLDQWYLLWGNAVLSYDAQPLVNRASRLSGAIGQFVAVAMRVHPTIRILPTTSNRALIAQLVALRARLWLVLILLVVACILLAVQLAISMTGPHGAVAP
jgi:Transglutaminase-like superfamily